jgi:hypothetical protein
VDYISTVLLQTSGGSKIEAVESDFFHRSELIKQEVKKLVEMVGEEKATELLGHVDTHV